MPRSEKARAKAEARREARAKAKWEHETERRARLCYAVERGGGEHGLSTAETSVLQAIAIGDQTWMPVADLASVGLNGDTLHGLVEVGWVEDFPLTDGTAVTLSPWAAEVLDLESEERWNVQSVIAEQEDSSGERTRMTVRSPEEVPRWATRQPPPEPGMPRPKPRPIRLPTLYRLSRLPEDVVKGLLARMIADPVEEAMENEEKQRAADRERYLERESRTEDGRLDVDEGTGRVRIQPVLLWASPAEDGLRGGLATSHDGKIPVDERITKGRKPGKKGRKHQRPA